MGKRIDPVIVFGSIRGSCPKCREPFEGDIGSDTEEVELECLSCGHIGKYFYNWPDELPKVTLRHVSNGRALGQKSKKKTKNKNPDQVLRGQLSFPWGIR